MTLDLYILVKKAIFELYCLGNLNTKIKKYLLSVGIFFFFTITISSVFARFEDRLLTRGEATAIIIRELDLKNKNSDFLDLCDKEIDLCMFDFSARSKFKKLNFKTNSYYPDLSDDYLFAQDVITATKLGLVSGYFADEESPFRPRSLISRAEALKIALIASKKMRWKERFETEAEINNLQNEYLFITESSNDTSFFSFEEEDGWWKIRFSISAFKNNLIKISEVKDPDAPITNTMLEEWLSKLK